MYILYQNTALLLDSHYQILHINELKQGKLTHSLYIVFLVAYYLNFFSKDEVKVAEKLESYDSYDTVTFSSKTDLLTSMDNSDDVWLVQVNTCLTILKYKLSRFFQK